MGDRRGARSAGSSKRIESITVAILAVVSGSWTISAHGMFLLRLKKGIEFLLN